MSTQIFITPNQCKPEFTKIVEHSFGFKPQDELERPPTQLLIGGKPEGLSAFFWSSLDYNFRTDYIAGLINPLKSIDQALSVPVPINLVPDDIVTMVGTAHFNNALAWIRGGYNVKLILGVYYINCSDFNKETLAQTYTFIPVETFDFNDSGIACFSTETILSSNFDKHDARLVIGYNIYAECPINEGRDCTPPIVFDPFVTITQTLDVERPCAAGVTNFIIRNCCEPVITELVNIPGLQVGSFHVDDEGNCWEVMSASTDVTNFTRNFVNNYDSCQKCQDENGCPDNLIIASCCIEGQEYVTGSLPGLSVGDTFVDNHGLCWYVSNNTPAPISEESITVDTIIMGDCEECRDANPCPTFWYIQACCKTPLSEIIATTVALNSGDAFVDTDGICWTVNSEAFSLPTNYDIVVDTVYTGGVNNCEDCQTANPCPEEYFVTVRACCDTDRVEVIAVPAESMVFFEGLIFSDQYNICWEVMSYSTTGVGTYTLNTFKFGTYESCFECITASGKGGCPTLWQVRDCSTTIVYTAKAFSFLTVGSFYNGGLDTEVGMVPICFEVLGYGYPDIDPLSVIVPPLSSEWASCLECVRNLSDNN
jgi:hypothetical protein